MNSCNCSFPTLLSGWANLRLYPECIQMGQLEGIGANTYLLHSKHFAFRLLSFYLSSTPPWPLFGDCSPFRWKLLPANWNHVAIRGVSMSTVWPSAPGLHCWGKGLPQKTCNPDHIQTQPGGAIELRKYKPGSCCWHNEKGKSRTIMQGGTKT